MRCAAHCQYQRSTVVVNDGSDERRFLRQTQQLFEFVKVCYFIKMKAQKIRPMLILGRINLTAFPYV